MRYVQGLIPIDKKVLPNYFRNYPFELGKKNHFYTILGYLGSVFFLLSALTYFHALVVALLHGVVCFAISPPGHNVIEKIGRFRFTALIKSIFCAVLILLSFPFIDEKSNNDKQIADKKTQQEQTEHEAATLVEKKEQARKDSFKIRYSAIQVIENSGKPTDALRVIDSELSKSHSSEETKILQDDKTKLERVQVLSIVKCGNYKNALPLLFDLLSKAPNDQELLYKRAFCYSKLGKIQEAVNDLKILIQSGNDEATKLHEKINPIKKRVVGYTTLCCDGTSSSARGRGACSWHGGVCDWNHPIYEEYRKYE